MLGFGEKVKIKAEGYSLAGRLYGNSEDSHKHPAVLFLRGWSPGIPRTFEEFYASHFAKRLGMVCLAATFRSMGSPGDINALTRQDFFNDALLSYDYLASLKSVDPSRIFVAGESFGGYMASLLSEKRNVRGLALRVPTDFPNTGFEDEPHVNYALNRSMGWKLQKHEHGESLALDAMHRFGGDILIVASGNDKIVPRQTTDNYVAAVSDVEKLKYILMKNAGHGLFSPLKQKEYERMLADWLSEKI